MRNKKYKFVIQKHNAKKAGLHYDLRLENKKGKLDSWFMPKSPPPDKYKTTNGVYAQKTNTHNEKWAEFEGTIPDGKYGAGSVKIWDKGAIVKTHESHHNIVFIVVEGKKLKGRKYVLHRLKYDNWILFRAKVKPYEKRKFLESNFMESVADASLDGMLEKIQQQDGISGKENQIDKLIKNFDRTHERIKKIKVISWLNEIIFKLNEKKKIDPIMQESFDFLFKYVIKHKNRIPNQKFTRQLFIVSVGQDYNDYDTVIRNIYFKNFFKISYIFEYYYIIQRFLLTSMKFFRDDGSILYDNKLKELFSFNSFVNREIFIIFTLLSYYTFRKISLNIQERAFYVRKLKISYTALKKYLYSMDWFENFPFKEEFLNNKNKSIIMFLFNLIDLNSTDEKLFRDFINLILYYFKMNKNISITWNRNYNIIRNETYKEYFSKNKLFDSLYYFLYNVKIIEKEREPVSKKTDNGIGQDVDQPEMSSDFFTTDKFVTNLFFNEKNKKDFTVLKKTHSDFMNKVRIRLRNYEKNLTLTKENF